MSTLTLNMISIVAIVAAFASSIIVVGSVFAQGNITGGTAGGNSSLSVGGNSTGANITSSVSAGSAGGPTGGSSPSGGPSY